MGHPIVVKAARGRLPAWARVSAARLEHMRRVSALMGEWAQAMALDPSEVARWKAVGFLHDVLRDAPPGELLPLLEGDERQLSGELAHGPAAAMRLREEGVEDEDFLRAVAYHTVGHPELEVMGRHLYMADFLEPGRPFEPEVRSVLRRRVPPESDAVLTEVVRLRIEHLLRQGRSPRRETTEFRSRLEEEADG